MALTQARIVPKYERGAVPYKPLQVLPGANFLYEPPSLQAGLCGGMPTLKFDFHVNQTVKIKGLISKPEWNGREAIIKKLPSDPADSEARYEVTFIDGADAVIGFRARPCNLVQSDPTA